MGVAGDIGFGEGDDATGGEFLEANVLDLDVHGGAAVNLESEEAGEGTGFLFVIDEVDGDFSVEFMDEVIALGDNGVLVPLGDVDFDGVAFGDDPLLSLRVDDDALAVLDDDAAAAFVVDHGVVHGGGMHVALVTADGPLAVLGEFAAPVLDAGVVAGLLDLGVEDEVLHFTAAPDQKLIVAELFRAGGLAGDRAVFDGPEFLVGVPVGEVFAVEERAEAVIGGVQGKGAQEEGEKQSGFHGAIGLGCVPPLLIARKSLFQH